MGSVSIDQDNSSNADRRLQAAIERALEMAGGIVESAAKEILTANKSVDTGLLRNSITHAIGGEYPAIDQYSNNAGGTSKSGKKIEEKIGTYDQPAPRDTGNERSVYIGTNVEYAPFVELGTSRSTAKPYLRPAVEQSKEKIRRAFQIAFRGL